MRKEEKEIEEKKSDHTTRIDIHRFHVHLSFLIVWTITLRWWVRIMSKYSIQVKNVFRDTNIELW